MKHTKRKAFNFLRSYFDVVNKLQTDEDKLSFLMSIINKQFLNEDPEELKFPVDLAYESQINAIDSSVKGWLRVFKTDLQGKTQDTPPTPPKGKTNSDPKEEKEEEEEKEKEQSNREAVNFKSILKEWNNYDWSLPVIKSINEGRKTHVRARIKEHGREELTNAFKKVKDSEFLQGRKSNFKCSFDWVMNPTNFLKIIEGNYDNKNKAVNQNKGNTPSGISL